MESEDEQKFRKALRLIDLTDTYNKESAAVTSPHSRNLINYGKLYLDAANLGFRAAVLNVAEDLAL